MTTILRTVDVTVTEPAPEGALLLFPVPFGHWDQRCEAMDVQGDVTLTQIRAKNTPQPAILAQPTAAGPIRIRYEIRCAPASVAPHIWQVPPHRLTTASPELKALAQEIAGGKLPREAVRALAEYAAANFSYGHVEKRFSDGWDSVPAICGLQRGSCVDINTFTLAAALSLGIRGQYLAGYWFGPERFSTPDMHCWLVFEIDGQPEFWDIAHHLKWGVDGFSPGLNPAGGRRVAMSAARGLQFDTPNGLASEDHFCEPVWVLPGGATRYLNLKIDLTEERDLP